MIRLQYKKTLVDEYKLRRLSKRKAVMNVNDLYYVLFYHWVHDDSIFPDEQQRNQVPTGLLMAAYFNCRPISMFDTRLKLEDDENAIKPDDHVTVHIGLSDNNGN